MIVEALLEVRYGVLWIGTGRGLYRRLPDGRALLYTIEQGLPDDFVQALLEDGSGTQRAGAPSAG